MRCRFVLHCIIKSVFLVDSSKRFTLLMQPHSLNLYLLNTSLEGSATVAPDSSHIYNLDIMNYDRLCSL